LAQQSALAIDVSEIERGIETMTAAAGATDREPSDLRVVLRLVDSAGAPELVAARIDELSEIGVTDVVIDVDWTNDNGAELAAAALIDR
jgi:hypothetical protein